MRHLLFLAVYTALLLLLSHSPWDEARAAESGEIDKYPKVRLCESLQTVRHGDKLTITVSGMYRSGAEISMLFDPDQRICTFDVQPSTWVEFSPSALNASANDYAGVFESEEPILTAVVTFQGELWGPRTVAAEDHSEPPMIDYAKRAGRQRYGHLGLFRTKFVVESILFAEALPTSNSHAGEIHEQMNERIVIPTVRKTKIPEYPTLAQRVGVEGRVVVEVGVENGSVLRTAVLSGDRLLLPDTLDNIKSWQFDSGVSTTFITTFTYELELRLTNQPRGSKVLLELPENVTVIGVYAGW